MFKIWFKFLVITLLLLVSIPVKAVNIFQLDKTPLPATQAYQFSAERQGDKIIANWTMAQGYYLYQDRFCFILNNQPLYNVVLPPAELFHDEILGNFKGYSNHLAITLPIPIQKGKQNLILKVCYQGCSRNHFCYPPTAAQVILPPYTQKPVVGSPIPVPDIAPQKAMMMDQNKLNHLLLERHWWLSLLSFLVMGILLSATPCVLPMLPILSSLIVGQQHISTKKAFTISLVYVLAMALTYAIIGIIAGLLGANLQVIFQTPAAIIGLSVLFFILALSFFGFYEIRLPHRLATRLIHVSNYQKQGSFIGAAIMGILATLIVSPCVSPALIAGVAYIAQTGNTFMGGLMLFSMALGMGLPLLLVGIFGGKILPHAGTWMETIKQVFGVLLLATALYLMARILPIYITLMLWATLFLVLSIFLGLLQPAHTNWAKFWKGIALLFAISGGLILYQAVLSIPGLSWHNDARAAGLNSTLHFTPIQNVTELNQALTYAASKQKITMIDFYADWCLACKEMDLITFSDTKVKQKLLTLQVTRVDMTHNTAEINALKQRYNVIAPPTIIFVDAKGEEIPNSRIIGSMGSKEFMQRLDKI